MKIKLLSCAALLAFATAAMAEATHTASGKSTSAKSPVSTTKASTGAKAPAKPAAQSAIKPAAKGAIPPEEETEHIVKEGETLGGIANRAKVPRVMIIEANHLEPPFAVKHGQKLLLPRTRRHVVKAGESGFDIAYQYGVPFSEIAVANSLETGAKLKAGQVLLIPALLKPSAIAKAEAEPAAKPAAEKPSDNAAPRLLWPVESKVRRGFTPRSKTDDNGDYHEGLDIPAAQGTAVRASASGTVIFAGKEPERFGNMVVIEHENGWQTAYGFLAKVTVKKGDTVTAHERVGLVGHAGQASRDELHFELRRANKPQDPAPYLPKAKKVEAKKAEPKKAKPKTSG